MHFNLSFVSTFKQAKAEWIRVAIMAFVRSALLYLYATIQQGLGAYHMVS